MTLHTALCSTCPSSHPQLDQSVSLCSIVGKKCSFAILTLFHRCTNIVFLAGLGRVRRRVSLKEKLLLKPTSVDRALPNSLVHCFMQFEFVIKRKVQENQWELQVWLPFNIFKNLSFYSTSGKSHWQSEFLFLSSPHHCNSWGCSPPLVQQHAYSWITGFLTYSPWYELVISIGPPSVLGVPSSGLQHPPLSWTSAVLSWEIMPMAVPALSDWEDWSYHAGHRSGDHKPTAWQQPAPSPPCSPGAGEPNRIWS